MRSFVLILFLPFLCEACLRSLGKGKTGDLLPRSLRDIQEHLLHTVGIFLYQFPAGRKNIVQTNLLERLINPLGWPSVLLHAEYVGHPSHFHSSSSLFICLCAAKR